MSPGSYVLIVSTIEARKNHLLAFRAWRRMVEEMPPEQVPTLVFAGRIGWLVQDLMQQIENCGHLGGKLVVVDLAVVLRAPALLPDGLQALAVQHPERHVRLPRGRLGRGREPDGDVHQSEAEGAVPGRAHARSSLVGP